MTLPVRVLGDGLDVGRSCILLTLGHRNVLPDAGAHPAYADSTRRLPDFASLPPLDAVLVPHFHLDHAGALLALYESSWPRRHRSLCSRRHARLPRLCSRTLVDLGRARSAAAVPARVRRRKPRLRHRDRAGRVLAARRARPLSRSAHA
jgi:Cft2 family RNA processing exonuclease